MLSLCAMVMVGALADEVPRGTDLVARVEVGKLAKDVRAGWQELEPLFDAWPALGSMARSTHESWLETAHRVAEASGANFERPSAVATLFVDLDGPTWAAVVRGAQPKARETHDFLIDEHPAYRIAGRGVAWTVVDGALVVGDERGLQRQVRQLHGDAVDEPIVTRARRLRGREPVQVAFEAPAATRAELSRSLANVGPLLGAIHGATLVAAPGRVWLQLAANDADGQKALRHGMRGFVAVTRASTSLLEGGAQAVMGLELLHARPAAIPAGLDMAALEQLANEWLAGFTVKERIRDRRPHIVEAELELSSYRGLIAALGLVSVMVWSPTAGPQAEAEVLLELLRRAELAHHARTGEFVSCGPVPENLPTGPTDWPSDSCFDAIEFSPPTKVRFQLVAGVEKGELVLMARGDTNGDGEAEIWVLEGNAVAVRPLLP